MVLRTDRTVPEPRDKELQEQLEEQLTFSRQLEEQFVNEQTADNSEKAFINKEIAVPTFPLEPDNQRATDLAAEAPIIDVLEVKDPTIDVTQRDSTTIAESTGTTSKLPSDSDSRSIEVQQDSPLKQEQKQKPKPKLTAQVFQEDIDVIGQLEKKKRTKWVVQVGAFGNQNNANELIQKLKNNKSNYEVFVQKRKINGTELQIIFVGPVLNESEAIHRQKQIREQFKVNAVVKTYKELGL